MIGKLLARFRRLQRPGKGRRNPTDPAQAYLIARAEAKRARRAEKLNRDAKRSFVKNRTNDGRLALNPFYVAQ